MEFGKELKIKNFEKFYSWLKEDGLKPRKSERLHKKKIFENLIGNDIRTLENFEDFFKEQELQKEIMSYVGRKIKTTNGIKTIASIIEKNGQLTVGFNEDYSSLLVKIEILKKAINQCK